MSDHPKSLSKVKVNFREDVSKRADELDELNFPYFAVSYRDEMFLEKIQDLSEHLLSDEWYARFKGGCYWSGILSAYPWSDCPVYYDLDEEGIWKEIIQHHTAIKGDDIVFKYNPESRLDKWLRRHTSDGDVPINVTTIIRHAIKVAVKHTDFYDFHEIDWTDDPIEPEYEEQIP